MYLGKIYYPASKKLLGQYWIDNYLLTRYWDLGYNIRLIKSQYR